ncbi:unnamed protein product, partial [Symbiodinium sp. CCMP2456]
MARVSAASRKKKPLFRLLSLMALSWACLQTAQPLWALAGPIVSCSSRSSSSTSSSISTGPHRQLRPLRVSPRRALPEVEEPSGDDEDQEQAASAQTTDLVEDATKASESAVGMRFCSWTIADCGRASEPSESEDDKDKIVASARDEQLQKTAQEKEDRYQQRVDLALKGCARAEKALQIATDELESVTKDLVFAREQRRKAVEDQNQQKQSTWDQNVKKAAEDVDKAKKDVDKAKEDFHKAEERLKEEEAKVSAAPAQAAG